MWFNTPIPSEGLWKNAVIVRKEGLFSEQLQKPSKTLPEQIHHCTLLIPLFIKDCSLFIFYDKSPNFKSR